MTTQINSSTTIKPRSITTFDSDKPKTLSQKIAKLAVCVFSTFTFAAIGMYYGKDLGCIIANITVIPHLLGASLLLSKYGNDLTQNITSAKILMVSAKLINSVAYYSGALLGCVIGCTVPHAIYSLYKPNTPLRWWD